MIMVIFFLLQENAISTNAEQFSEGENVIKKLSKIFWSRPVFKMEFEHKPSIHVILYTCCYTAASAVARAFLGCAINLTVLFFQFLLSLV